MLLRKIFLQVRGTPLGTITKKTIRLKKLPRKIDCTSYGKLPIKIWSGNYELMFLAMNSTDHSTGTHIDIQYHFVQEQLAQEVIFLSYIPTNNVAANGLTKALPKNLFTKFKKHLGLTGTNLKLTTHSLLSDASGSDEIIWSRGGGIVM